MHDRRCTHGRCYVDDRHSAYDERCTHYDSREAGNTAQRSLVSTLQPPPYADTTDPRCRESLPKVASTARLSTTT
ncbi:hypothetical protein DENSPDRAFT_836700 [Dentipellis sp. KUC8613]|nr:hypothetical protein DENSPDRAFT_836700 [Dentipellis sp. KUC8613]